MSPSNADPLIPEVPKFDNSSIFPKGFIETLAPSPANPKNKSIPPVPTLSIHSNPILDATAVVFLP